MSTPRLVVTAAVAGLLLFTGCGSGDDTAATVTTAPATSAPTTPPVTTSPVATTPAGTPSTDPSADAAIELVQGWLSDLGDGDLEKAGAALGSWSRQAADSMGGLESMASGLAEGMAAFGAAGLEWDAVALPDHEGAYVVVASGQVEREGMREDAARAWVVHPEDGQDVVEAFAARTPEVVAPLPGEILAAQDPVEAFVPVGAVHAVVDGGLATSGVGSEGADGDQLRVSVAPDGQWPAQRHVVAVVSVPESPDAAGPWAAVAVAFEVG